MKALFVLVSLLSLQGCGVMLAQEHADRAAVRLHHAEDDAAACLENREEALAARAAGNDVQVPSCAAKVTALSRAQRNEQAARDDVRDARHRAANAARAFSEAGQSMSRSITNNQPINCTSYGFGNLVQTSCQ